MQGLWGNIYNPQGLVSVTQVEELDWIPVPTGPAPTMVGIWVVSQQMSSTKCVLPSHSLIHSPIYTWYLLITNLSFYHLNILGILKWCIVKGTASVETVLERYMGHIKLCKRKYLILWFLSYSPTGNTSFELFLYAVRSGNSSVCPRM